MKEVCGTCKNNKRSYDGPVLTFFDDTCDDWEVKMSDFKIKFCQYCNTDSDGYIRPIEKNCHAFISYGINGWVLSLRGGGWHGECKIRYCPMCGRDLLVK